jgi:hypothetical protein
MGSTIPLPVVWYGQSFEGEPLPEAVDGVSEEARFRAAPFGAYVYLFRQQSRYAFSSAVYYNGDAPDVVQFDEQVQFEASEDIEGSERALVVRSTRHGLSIESVKVIPMADPQQPLDFKVFGDGAGERTLRYGENPPPECMQVRVTGLDILNIESALACVRAEGRAVQQFSEPLAAYIERAEVIRVDRLRNSGGEARGLEEQIRALFAVTFDNVSARTVEVECGYQYRLGEGSLETSVPITLLPKFNLTDPAVHNEIPAELASGLKRWYRDMSPEEGAFVFGLRVYGVRSPQPAPVLYLRQLLLPFRSIADLK